MSKYIDSEKLIAEIERLSATEYGDNTFGDDVANGALDYVLEEIIPSLQQEQPEIDLEKEIDSFFPESYFDTAINFDDAVDIARHFYKLGLNARKED